jgi:hypothetical protein
VVDEVQPVLVVDRLYAGHQGLCGRRARSDHQSGAARPSGA